MTGKRSAMAELRRDEALQRLREIDDTVAAHEEQFEVIRGGYDRVVKSNSAMEKMVYGWNRIQLSILLKWIQQALWFIL